MHAPTAAPPRQAPRNPSSALSPLRTSRGDHGMVWMVYSLPTCLPTYLPPSNTHPPTYLPTDSDPPTHAKQTNSSPSLPPSLPYRNRKPTRSKSTIPQVHNSTTQDPRLNPSLHTPRNQREECPRKAPEMNRATVLDEKKEGGGGGV